MVWNEVVIGVDPAVSVSDTSNETGIIVVARKESSFYVLADWSCRAPPTIWAKKVIEAYHYFKSHRVIAEINQGGNLVESILKSIDASVRYKGVRAVGSKTARALPIVSLYEQGRVFHTKSLSILEEQLCSFIPGKESPDRMDALVWAITDLMIKPKKSPEILII
jgi:phage terminase large subunit-like protein